MIFCRRPDISVLLMLFILSEHYILTRSCQSRSISSSDEAESRRGVQEQTATTRRALMGFIIRAALASGGRRSKSRPSSLHLCSQRTPTRLTTNTTLPNPFFFFSNDWLKYPTDSQRTVEKNNRAAYDTRNHNDEQDFMCCSSSKRYRGAETVDSLTGGAGVSVE